MSSVPLTKNIIGVDEPIIYALIKFRHEAYKLAINVTSIKLTEDELRRLYKAMPALIKSADFEYPMFLADEDLFIYSLKSRQANFRFIGLNVLYKGENYERRSKQTRPLH